MKNLEQNIMKTSNAKSFHFFWSGPFSQWYRSKFKIDGITYNCAEQYMMAEKARLFNDQEALENIMKANTPSEQKAIGRKIVNFIKNKWEEMRPWGDNERPYCWQIVWKGNHAKFTQNKRLKEILLATDDDLLVEASPYDVIWGIGLREDDPKVNDPSLWRGKNWLGEVITDVREAIRNNQKYPGSV